MLNSVFSAPGPMFLALGKIGITELLVILAIVLLIFGPKQLPKLAKTFGETIKGFKDGVQDGSGDGKAEKSEAKAEEKSEEKDA